MFWFLRLIFSGRYNDASDADQRFDTNFLIEGFLLVSSLRFVTAYLPPPMGAPVSPSKSPPMPVIPLSAGAPMSPVPPRVLLPSIPLPPIPPRLVTPPVVAPPVVSVVG